MHNQYPATNRYFFNFLISLSLCPQVFCLLAKIIIERWLGTWRSSALWSIHTPAQWPLQTRAAAKSAATESQSHTKNCLYLTFSHRSIRNRNLQHHECFSLWLIFWPKTQNCGADRRGARSARVLSFSVHLCQHLALHSVLFSNTLHDHQDIQ